MFPPYPRRPDPVVSTRPILVLAAPMIAAWHDLTIPGSPIEATPSIIAVYTSYPASEPRPELDITIVVNGTDDEDVDHLPISATPSLHGGWLEVTIFAPHLDATPAILGTYVGGELVAAATTVIAGNAQLLYGEVTGQAGAAPGETIGSNWLRWSKIGELNFTIGRNNEAGQMPLPWQGPVWQIARVGGQGPIVVYGKNGVATLQSNVVAYGYKKVLSVGLKNKLAFVDTGEAHYFIDGHSRLWAWSDGPHLLDYREWLATLTSPALSFDPNTRLLYLCDGTNGYVYNVDTQSMGKGPATYTGIQPLGGSLYVVKSGTVSVPTFAITTDIRDFGTRKAKTVRYLEAAVDTTLTLEGSIDYRLEKHGSFTSLAWYPFDSRGHCYLNTYGYEFRFKVRATSGGWFHLDRLSVFGVTHAH